MDMSSGEQDLVEHVRTGKVGAQHTERDGQEQQRLKAFTMARYSRTKETAIMMRHFQLPS